MNTIKYAPGPGTPVLIRPVITPCAVLHCTSACLLSYLSIPAGAALLCKKTCSSCSREKGEFLNAVFWNYCALRVQDSDAGSEIDK